jgi:hypothetical protein
VARIKAATEVTDDLVNTITAFIEDMLANLSLRSRYLLGSYTAKTQHRKFETNISRKEIARPQSQFPHSCVCERFIYSHDGSAYSAAGNTYVDRFWEYI